MPGLALSRGARESPSVHPEVPPLPPAPRNRVAPVTASTASHLITEARMRRRSNPEPAFDPKQGVCVLDWRFNKAQARDLRCLIITCDFQM